MKNILKEMGKTKYKGLEKEARKLVEKEYNQSQIARMLSKKYNANITRSLIHYHLKRKFIRNK